MACLVSFCLFRWVVLHPHATPRRSPSSHEVLFARNHLLMQAKALRLDVIDMVLIDYKDPQRLEQESQLAFELGFTGKQVIHPNQIDVVQRCFSPQPDAIARYVDALMRSIKGWSKAVPFCVSSKADSLAESSLGDLD